MKVQTLQQINHMFPEGDPRMWLVIPPGSIVDMPEGEEWVRQGLAVPVVKKGAPEKAVVKPTELRTHDSETMKTLPKDVISPPKQRSEKRKKKAKP